MMDGMIEIRLSNGDSAWAETPEAAVLAALTLIEDADRATGNAFKYTASFYGGNGKLVQQGLTRVQLRSHLPVH